MLLANPDKADIRAQAKKDRDLKLYWESRVAKDVRREFRRMGDDYEAVYGHTGHPISMTTYEHDIVAVLRDTYRAVGKAFSGNMRAGLSPSLNSRLKGPALAAEIDHTLTTAFEARAKKQAAYILGTTRERMSDALVQAHADAIEAGESPAQHDIAAAMGRWFRDAAPGRAASIAMTEVGSCAEFAKGTEAAALHKALKKGLGLALLTKGRKVSVFFPPGSSNFMKVWQADLDEKTRPAHVEADWQAVDATEPFTVMGEQLMRPGDESMGASLENIINCRCSALYYVEGEGFISGEPDLE